MSYFNFRASEVSRGNNLSIAERASYISGRTLRDCYSERTFETLRDDVQHIEVYGPADMPAEYHDLQSLCDALNKAERRRDAQTAREIRGALPKELDLEENIRIARQFALANFVRNGLCVAAAFHEGRNPENLKHNNPHVHLLVSTRTVDFNGFNPKKAREFNQKRYLYTWREQFANAINVGYERNGLDIRVDHRSYRERGIIRIPRNYLSQADWKREQQGIRTPAGDVNREIQKRNEEIERIHNHELEYTPSVEHDR